MRTDSWVILMTRENFISRTYQVYYRCPPYRFTTARGSAERYESENAARHVGYLLKEQGTCIDFTIEHIPADPARRSGTQGTGGAA